MFFACCTSEHEVVNPCTALRVSAIMLYGMGTTAHGIRLFPWAFRVGLMFSERYRHLARGHIPLKFVCGLKHRLYV